MTQREGKSQRQRNRSRVEKKGSGTVTQSAAVTPVTQDTAITPTTLVTRETAAQSGEGTAQQCLLEQQYGDPELWNVIQYLQSGVLPEDNVDARKLTMSEGQYSIVDGVLYNLREAKIHSQLARHYWWPAEGHRLLV